MTFSNVLNGSNSQQEGHIWSSQFALHCNLHVSANKLLIHWC